MSSSDLAEILPHAAALSRLMSGEVVQQVQLTERGGSPHSGAIRVI